jgi:hypothetical protein
VARHVHRAQRGQARQGPGVDHASLEHTGLDRPNDNGHHRYVRDDGHSPEFDGDDQKRFDRHDGDDEMTKTVSNEWGRVDTDGTVYVKTPEGERPVGQWPQGDPEQALAFYTKRFEGLEVEVNLLEQRTAAGAISPEDAQSRAAKLKETIVEAQAVGDLVSLLGRVDALAPMIEERRAQRTAERAQRVEETKAAKEKIASEAERLAASNDWRSGSDRMRQLLDEWKALGRIDKASDDALWHRFSTARTTYTRRRKAHFAEQSSQREASREAKEKLVAEAEELSTSTNWRETSQAYRDLMTRWKAAGSAQRADDDRLWTRFRAAQDLFFGARDQANAAIDKEFSANAETKRALLAEAEKLVPVRNARTAREAFRDIAARWDQAGKVPRTEMKELESRLRKVEQAIRDAEDDRWRRSNPEARARAQDTVSQLEATIADLQAQLAEAEASAALNAGGESGTGTSKKLDELRGAIAAREDWLAQARKTLSDFS